MLAGVALITVEFFLVLMKRERFVWVPLVPAVLLLIVTTTAGLQKIFHSKPAIGFLAHARKYSSAAEQGEILAPAKNMGQMQQIVFNDYVNTGLTVLFLSVVFIVAIYGLKVALKARKIAWSTAKEIPAVYRDEVAINEQKTSS
jgi:carbon starvation protein